MADFDGEHGACKMEELLFVCLGRTGTEFYEAVFTTSTGSMLVEAPAPVSASLLPIILRSTGDA